MRFYSNWRCIHVNMIRFLYNMGINVNGYWNLDIYYIKSIFRSITFKIKSISRYNFLLKEDKISKFAQHCLMINKLINI